jgi:hypothetical protein
MSTAKSANSLAVPCMGDVPRISDADRQDLIATLMQGRAGIAAGYFDVLTPEFLRKEFDAILGDDLSDEALDALLGIEP